MEILEKYIDRNFVVCSDCIHFEQHGIIDENYPCVKYGKCTIKHQRVTNLFQTKCKDFNLKYECKDCIHFDMNNDYCEKLNDNIYFGQDICYEFEQ